MHTNPEVLALRALGEDAGSPAEQAHIASCPVCAQEVAELARIADVGRTTTGSDSLSIPGPHVWERIRAELNFDAVRPADHDAGVATSPVNTSATSASVTDISARGEGSRSGRGTSSGRRFLALAVAAGLALIVGIGVGVGFERFAGPHERVIARADLSATAAWAGTTGTAEVTADGRGNRSLILKMTSPRPIDGKQEVWLINPQDTKLTAMGYLENGEARISVPLGMSLFETPVVDVSLEPVDDTDPDHHSGNTILRGALE